MGRTLRPVRPARVGVFRSLGRRLPPAARVRVRPFPRAGRHRLTFAGPGIKVPVEGKADGSRRRVEGRGAVEEPGGRRSRASERYKSPRSCRRAPSHSHPLSFQSPACRPSTRRSSARLSALPRATASLATQTSASCRPSTLAVRSSRSPRAVPRPTLRRHASASQRSRARRRRARTPTSSAGMDLTIQRTLCTSLRTEHSSPVAETDSCAPTLLRNWSTAYKCFVTFCISLLTFSVYIGSSIYSSYVPRKVNNSQEQPPLMTSDAPRHVQRHRRSKLDHVDL